MTAPSWIYRAKLVRVVDGDTLDLRVERDVDFGFRMLHQLSAVMRFRVVGIDTPEKTGPTRELGRACTAYVERLLMPGLPLEVESFGEADKYGGRWDADVRFNLVTDAAGPPARWVSLARHLVTLGYAQPYDGKGSRPSWDPTEPYPLPKAIP